MKRAIAMAGLVLFAAAGNGCCHLWENLHTWEDCMFCECGDCGVHGCNWGWGDYAHSDCNHNGCGHDSCSGCGGCYYGEWHQPSGCDPCDCHGNWVGPGYGPAYGGGSSHGYPAGPAGPAAETIPPGAVVDTKAHSHDHISQEHATHEHSAQQQERSVIVAEQPDHEAHAVPRRIR